MFFQTLESVMLMPQIYVFPDTTIGYVDASDLGFPDTTIGYVNASDLCFSRHYNRLC